MTTSLRDQLLFASGQEFHDLFMSTSVNLQLIRAHLTDLKAALFELGDAFPATAHLQALNEAQKRVAAEHSNTLRSILALLCDVAPAGPKLDDLRARVQRGSASALLRAMEHAKDFADACEAGRALQRVSVSVDKLLAGALSIEQQIQARGAAADAAWIASMEKLVQEKRDAAAASTNLAEFRAAWTQTREFALMAQMKSLLDSINAAVPLFELHKRATAALNNGRASVVNGAAFEDRVAAATRDIVQLCGYDAEWFDECQRCNEALLPSTRNSSSAPWVDQSKSAHSVRCRELGKPNIRVAHNLSVLEPVEKDGVETWSAVGEIDGLVYDACDNTVLIWIEAKGHAADLGKADAQATGTLKKVFARRAVLSAERSKEPWFNADSFSLFRDDAARARRCVIVTRLVDAESPLRVPSNVVTAMQKLVWSVDDDAQLLDGVENIRSAVSRPKHRQPIEIVRFYESFGALDRIVLLPGDASIGRSG
jgi:hypothetical protein